MNESLIGVACIAMGLNMVLMSFCVVVSAKCDRLERELSARRRWQHREDAVWRERL